MKNNCKRIVGCRVKVTGRFYYDGSTNVTEVTPNDFLVGKSRLLPFTIYGTTHKVHVPRSLCTRASIVINVNKGNKVVSDQRNQPAFNRPRT